MGLRIVIWLGKKLATVIVIVAITLWLTGLMMTSVIQSVLKEYQIPLQVEPVIYSGVLSYLWGYEKTDIEESTSVSDEKGQISNNQTKATIDVTASEEAKEQPAVEVFAPVELEEQLEISKNELGIAKESLTEDEKVRLTQLLIDRIPTDEWQLISLYMEDGLSETELLETKQILALYLNDEEYRELIGILKKS